MILTLNGSIRDGIWSIANTDRGLIVQHERTTNNNTAMTAATIRDFFFVGDFLFQSYVNNSSAYAASKSVSSPSYSLNAIIETVINPNMPPEYRYQKKKLVAVGGMYDALPTAGQIVVKARVDSTGSYTTVFTETTDNAVSTEPTMVPSGGSYLDDGKEFEFQIISTGAAVPTALIYVFEVEETNAS